MAQIKKRNEQEININELKKEGFTHFKNPKFDEKTINIARRIGMPLELPNFPIIQKLSPSEKSQLNKNTYGGNYGFDTFPLHTDLAHWSLPPRYFLLHCINPGECVQTRFLSIDDIINDEDHFTLKRAIFRPRRRLNGRLNFLRIYYNGVFRWDNLFIRPMNNIASDLKSRIESKITSASAKAVVLASQAECILVDNWRVLHGRSDVRKLNSDRLVERVYLDDIGNITNATIRA